MSPVPVSRAGLVHQLRRIAILVAMTLGAACTLVEVSSAQTEPQLIKGTRVRVIIPAADRPTRAISNRQPGPT